jgi:pimeloyl-ACP methyl ester carboxylesterase
MDSSKDVTGHNQNSALLEAQPNREIYFISGLGADERVFQNLELVGFQPIHIQWESPHRGETLEHYASRLLEQVTSKHPILVGLSFGGLVAVEMAKQSQPAQVVLLSSASTAEEIPIYFRLLRWLPVHLVLPFKRLLWAMYWFLFWLFGLGAQAERNLLRQILLDTDARFMTWAMHRVVTWRNRQVPEGLVKVHGGRDRIFPVHNLDPDILLEDGGHFMVMNRAERLSAILMSLLASDPNAPETSTVKKP